MSYKKGRRTLTYDNDIDSPNTDWGGATDHDYASDGEYDDMDRIMLRYYKMKESLEWEEQ